MIRYFFSILILSLFILCSCDGHTKRILGDFSFSDAGLESTGNITFRSQGIIDTTFYVVDYWNDDSIIVAKGYWYQSSPRDDIGEPMYFIIDMVEYARNPEQLRSKAVVGPFTSHSLGYHIVSNDNKQTKSLLKFIR